MLSRTAIRVDGLYGFIRNITFISSSYFMVNGALAILPQASLFICKLNLRTKHVARTTTTCGFHVDFLHTFDSGPISYEARINRFLSLFIMILSLIRGKHKIMKPINSKAALNNLRRNKIGKNRCITKRKIELVQFNQGDKKH